MKKALMALVAASFLVPAAAQAQMFTATVSGQASGFISPGDQLGGEYGGILYAGTLDGTTPLFVTRCDHGMTWNPDTDACEGTRVALKYGAYDVATGATSMTDGAANTAILAARSDTPAAGYCADLAPPDVNSHGFSDWYLPAYDELSLLAANYIDFGLGYADYYWSSVELTTSVAKRHRFGYATQGDDISKLSTYFVRCMRKGN